MAGPSWLAGALAAVMISIAVYCSARLAASRLWHRPTAVDADGLHLVMGVAMAGMLVPQLRSLPGSAWEGMFGIGAAWFAGRAVWARRGNPGISLSAARCSTCSWPRQAPGPQAR